MSMRPKEEHCNQKLVSGLPFTATVYNTQSANKFAGTSKNRFFANLALLCVFAVKFSFF